MIDPGVALGAAVVKAVCKIWLKDNEIAKDTSIRVVDIIELKVSGWREQRRVKRMFEELEETVADKLLTSLEAEFRDLPENDRNSAILAAKEVFDQVKLDNKDLFAADLDPLFLERQLRTDSVAAVDGLGLDAIQLYDRIVSMCCGYIVEMCSTFPGFTVDAFSNLLARQSDISRQIGQLLDRVPQRNAGHRVGIFEAAYRQLVATQLDKIELFGISVSDTLRTYTLSTAYISLSVLSPSLAERIRTNEVDRIDDDKGTTKALDDTTIQRALAVTNRIFLRGEAGSGKTTLLQWMAVNAARRSFDEPLDAWNGKIPFMIRLRSCSDRDLPRPEQLLESLGRHISNEMPDNWVHDALRSGSAMVLIDGLDEVSEVRRDNVRSWLIELVETFPRTSYIVSSRPAVVGDAWLRHAGFDVVEIQPMTNADIGNFVTHWHKAFRETAVDVEMIERLQRSEEEILRTIRLRKHLRQLTTSPLLAALICALHLDRRMQLPNDRMELYAVALEMLLERRDVERQVGGTNIVMSRTEKLIILQDIAYWLIRNGQADASIDRLTQRISARLQTMTRHLGEASDVLSTLLARSGLLRKPVIDRIDFVHKTFQEYLAAAAAVETDDIGVLIRHAHDDQWREVIVMASGHAHQQQRDDLVRGILDRSLAESNNRHALQLLAIGCLQTSAQIAAPLNAKIQEVAKKLIPPRSMRDAAALAGAGDLALELVSSQPPRNARQVAATIRMASLIGGDLALSLIANLSNDSNSDIDAELLAAWDRFDVAEFGAEVMSKRRRIDYLEIKDSDRTAYLSNVSCGTLVCRFSEGYGDYSFVPNMARLRTLNVYEDKLLHDISDICDQQSLQDIHLGDVGEGVDLSQLERLSNLTKLEFDAASVSADNGLSALTSLKQIQVLNLSSMNSLTDNFAASLMLERIGFWHASELASLEQLADLHQLEKLKFLLLSKAHSLTSIDAIRKWRTTLTGVYIRARQLTDLSVLKEIPNLEFANLADTPVTDAGVVSDCKKLSILHLGSAFVPLPSLKPLRDLTKLRMLFLYTPEDSIDLSELSGVDDVRVRVRGPKGIKVMGKDKLGRRAKVELM
ncbi:NACHT domain-containing protein [Saccharothrix sp. NRRL B-16314]|uniref:NACHT domain-containing protein n=1 Tax=Saccharothrix sp. NRRL B-16314 TaxID=1463825 RepID=UPI0009DE82C8|nr:NACHT domain-containing protein [Saccharothrix sp. NRRL B-16314]